MLLRSNIEDIKVRLCEDSMKYKSFEDMIVWQKAMDLAVKVFELTDNLPKKEDYCFTSQIRNSSLSVSGNIAEGFGRKHSKDKLRFYYIARGSLSETKSHSIFGYRVAYFSQKDFDGLIALIGEIWEELNKLISSIERRT